MSTAELLRHLRARGVTLALAEDRLRCEGPPAALRPSVVADLKQNEPRLIRRLREEAEAQAAADKVGVMMLYWQRHIHRWRKPEYRRRRDLLLAWMDYRDAALA